jgi:Nucleotide modification associated domain 2
MGKLFTYIIPVDDGAAPNPFHGVCSLAICKPVIRRTAEVGDWVVGLGSRRAPSGNLEKHVVYAMNVDRKISLQDYDLFALRNLKGKIPNFSGKDSNERLGDCIYDFSKGVSSPRLRRSVHKNENIKTDLSGKYVLLSRHFFYFGSLAKRLPLNLETIVHQGQGHRKITDQITIARFEEWIQTHDLGVTGQPDFKVQWGSNSVNSSCRVKCASFDNCRNH